METQISNLDRINKLAEGIRKANTANQEDRQLVANSCKELYQLIEEDVVKADSEWMLKGMHNDLCNGNFAEPFMCEKKKTDFFVVKKVYEESIIPRI